jgi:hypothetical protein
MTISNMKNKSAIMAAFGSFVDKLSTNAYVTIDSVDVVVFRSKTFRFTAATNDLLVNVLGSIDGGANYDQTVDADVAVGSGVTVAKTYTGAYTHMRIQVKAAVAGSQGTLSTKFFGSWL